MNAALAQLAQRMQSTPGRQRTRRKSRAEEIVLDRASPEALVVDEQGGLARLQVRTELPWSQALEILRLLAEAQGGQDPETDRDPLCHPSRTTPGE